MPDPANAARTFSELTPAAQQRAVREVRALLAAAWWTAGDDHDIHDAIVIALAEALGTPHYLEASGVVTGIPRVALSGWDLAGPGWIALRGPLDRDNAPRLPWPDDIAVIQLVANDRGTGVHLVNSRIDATGERHPGPRDPADRKALDEPQPSSPTVEHVRLTVAVDAAVYAALQGGDAEYHHKTGDERARYVAEDHYFTENGDVGPLR